MAEKIIKTLEAEDIEIREINEKTRTIWHRISKEVKDRMGDIVRIDGIDTRAFRKKPTVLYGHNYAGLDPIPVIGSNIGFRKEGKSYYAGTRFLNPEENKLSGKLADLANDAWTLSRMKLIGWSIGFIPKETAPLKEKVAETGEEVTTGLDFKKSELLEYSLVLIPANQEAVNDAIAKGLVTKSVFPVVQAEPQLVDELTANIEDEDVEMRPYPNEHACRLQDPGKFEKFRRGTRKHEGKEYSIIFGKPKDSDGWEEQAYRYAKDTWTAGEAGSHCKAHEGTFEAAADEDAAPCADCRQPLDEDIQTDAAADDERQQANDMADLIKRMGELIDEHISIRRQVISVLKEKFNKEKK